MLKKILLLIFSSIFLVGCNNFDEEDALKKFETLVTESTNYNLEGSMEIVNNEDVYTYDVQVSYLKGDYYKVHLVNKSNDHEQVILKNEEGVYIVTPSLNKSFKFQSDWPNNSSQTYILDSILNDLKNDSNREFLEEKDNYIIKSSVNYPNNSHLSNQSVTFNKEMMPEKIEVFNENGNVQITMVITELDLNANNDKNIFALNSIIENSETTETKETATIDEIIYPMYIPTGTSYSSEEKITNELSERVILTYTGEKPFIMIEETSVVPNEVEVTAVNGELVTYGNIIGVMTDTSLNWTENGMEYYLISSNMNAEELLQIASSTATVSVAATK